METVKVCSLGQISRRCTRSAASTGATCSAERARWPRPRIVCLVPSITELVCDLGLAGAARRAHRLLHPPVGDRAARSPRSAAPRTSSWTGPRAEAHPRHRQRRREPRETAEALAEFVPDVIVTHPRAPRDNLDLYRHSAPPSTARPRPSGCASAFEAAYAEAAARPRRRPGAASSTSSGESPG